jgi:hypothetical protein
LQLKVTLTQENITLQDKSRKLKEAGRVNSTLTKQLYELENELKLSSLVQDHLTKQNASKKEVLQSNNKKEKQLQTTIDGLKEADESLNWAAEWLCEQPEDVSTCKVQGDSFGTRPKKMRISQRLFIRF